MADETILDTITAGDHPCYDIVEVQTEWGPPSIVIRESDRHEKQFDLPPSVLGILGQILTRIAKERGW